MYSSSVAERTQPPPLEVGVRDLRADLAHWLSVARAQEVVITDRGRPVARLVPVGAQPGLDALIAEGVVTPPARTSGPASATELIPARTPVSDLVPRQRR